MQVQSLFLFLFIIFASCNSNTSKSAVETLQPVNKNIPELLLKSIEAHGGVAQWQKAQTWEYTIQRNEKPEHHLIDLQTRKVLLTHEDYRLGFDGKEVWVSPNKAAFDKGSPRFYHNLVWYFHAFPFIMADPGINYEILPQKELDGKLYDAIKITFNDGVGDAPDDYYIAHFDPDTHLMYLLLYTVTYFNQAPSTKYNALVYDEWENVNGLLVPSKMIGYQYEDDQLGEKRYERPFTDIKIANTPPDASIFEMPAEAEIDPLK